MEIENISSFWPGWEIQGLIGQGGYGKVYKAQKADHSLITEAAIKVVSVPQNDSEIESLHSEGLDEKATKTYFSEIVDDFINEIKLMETMKGISNIVSVEDFKVVDRTDRIGWDIYIRMELLTPFSKYIEKNRLTEEEVLKLGIDICTALEICAKQNIIHRDIKPENIFISRFGDFKVGDFGIAKKLEKTNSSMSAKGTQSYIAPEVLRSSSYDATVDIYSLGIVLYKLMNNNRLPLMDTRSPQISYKDKVEAVEKRLSGTPLPLPCNADPELGRIILTACEFNPAKRFKSATALKKALISYQMKVMNRSASDTDATVTLRSPVPPKPLQPPPPQPQYRTQPHPQPQPQPQYYTPPVYKEPSFTSPPQPKKKKKTWLIVTIISLLLVAGVVTALFFLGVFDSKTSGTASEKKSSVSEAYHASQTDGDIFYNSNGIVAEVNNIGYEEGQGYLDISITNNTSERILFEALYLDVNSVKLTVWFSEYVEAGENLDSVIMLFDVYTYTMGIESAADIIDFTINYTIYDSNYNYICENGEAFFLTDSYTEAHSFEPPEIDGDTLVSEHDFEAKVAGVYLNEYIDIVFSMDNDTDKDYYMEVNTLYLNGEEYPIPYADEGDFYYIDSPSGSTVLDDFFFGTEELEKYDLTVDDVYSVRACGYICDAESNSVLYTFDTGTFYSE